MKRLKIFSDGCSRGNPGPAGIGFLIFDENNCLIFSRGKYVGVRTNNEAEYLAAITALKEVLALGASEVELFSDSELLVKQVRGEYSVRSGRLEPLYRELISLIKNFEKFVIKRIERGENREADKIARLAAYSPSEV